MSDGLREWSFGFRHFRLGQFPLIMGIVNATPDSFSDGGLHFEAERAVEQACLLVEQGADLLDVGGESTRPGAEPVDVQEELRRVVPVIERLASRTSVPISIDTTKAEVARQALQAGAVVVNDISGLRFDPHMPEVCAAADAGVVCMHMQGTPQTMQDDPHYGDVVREVREFFVQRLNDLARAGIAVQRVVLDPGIGFGKTAEHNLQLLSHIETFRGLHRPVLVGHSRKRFLAKVLGRPVDERTAGSVGVAVALAMQGTDIIRVHDVQATRNALVAWHAVASRVGSSSSSDIGAG